ncbi:MAG: hypothetical protein SWY16_01895 [Cyanobacteriota bacterium]|nr:hypothetical protein [Cyanobacteriota bacterium]
MPILSFEIVDRTSMGLQDLTLKEQLTIYRPHRSLEGQLQILPEFPGPASSSPIFIFHNLKGDRHA